MNEQLSNRLGDYLPEADLRALPFGADESIGVESWPPGTAGIFARMNTDEQHSYMLHAAWWAAQNGVDVATAASTSLGLLVGGPA